MYNKLSVFETVTWETDKSFSKFLCVKSNGYTIWSDADNYVPLILLTGSRAISDTQGHGQS
jgi:hypothetical protein